MSRQQNPILAEPKKNSTDAQTTSTPRYWHEDPNEQQVLLNLLNREGFALEDAVYEALSTYRHDIKLHRGDVFEGVPHRDNDRIEIDLWAQSGNFVFLIESKKSEYDWIFLQNQGSAKDVHIISGPQKTASIRNRILNCVDCVSKQVVEVLPTDDKRSLYRQTQNQKTKNIMLPVRSARDDLARSAIRQAVFNHSEILRWGHHYENNLCHLGNPAHISEIRHDDKRFKGTHNKTVFVVSKNQLLSFIDKIRIGYI